MTLIRNVLFDGPEDPRTPEVDLNFGLDFTDVGGVSVREGLNGAMASKMI